MFGDAEPFLTGHCHAFPTLGLFRFLE